MLLAHLILIISHYPRTHKHGPNCTVETQERDYGVEASLPAFAGRYDLPLLRPVHHPRAVHGRGPS